MTGAPGAPAGAAAVVGADGRSRRHQRQQQQQDDDPHQHDALKGGGGGSSYRDRANGNAAVVGDAHGRNNGHAHDPLDTQEPDDSSHVWEQHGHVPFRAGGYLGLFSSWSARRFCRMGFDVDEDMEEDRPLSPPRTRKRKGKGRGRRSRHGRSSGDGGEGEGEEGEGKSVRIVDRFKSPLLITRLVMMALLVVMTVVLALGTWFVASNAYSSSVDAVAFELRIETLTRVNNQFMLQVQRARDTLRVFGKALEAQLSRLNSSQFTYDQMENQVGPLIWVFFDEIRSFSSSLSYFQSDSLSLGYTLLNTTMTNSTEPTSTKYLPSSSATALYPSARLVNRRENDSIFITTSNSSSSPSNALFFTALADNSTGRQIGPLTQAFSKPEGELQVISFLLNASSTSSGGGDSSMASDTQDTIWVLLATPLNILVMYGAHTVRDPATQKPAGVALISSTADVISQYLGQARLNGSVMFVSSLSGTLIAFAVTGTDSSSANNSFLVNASRSSNPVVAGAASYLEVAVGLPTLVRENVNVSGVYIEGKPWYISSVPYLVDNIQSYICLVVPREAIMGSLDSQERTIVLILSLVAVGLLLIGWVVVIWLTIYVETRMRPKEELLRQQEETQRAQAASEVKSQFLANISHDLRTPMAGILGLLDIMLCDHLTAEQEANLRQMKSCCASLLGLLNNLLDLAKVEAGKMQLEVLEFDIVGELESLVDMFSVQGLTNGTEIALDLADDIERTVKGDPSRVRQVFANLLSNACKFTKNGHVIVRGWMKHSPPPNLDGVDLSIPGEDTDRKPGKALSKRASDAPDEAARHGGEHTQGGGGAGEKRRVAYMFEVDDTGPGIPQHKRNLIFENFQQADTSTARTHGGTGLGLGIVRSLVELMGGKIAVVDKDGSGACFRFSMRFEALDHNSTWKNSMLQPEFLLPKLTTVEGGQVLLAMGEDSAGAAIATAWLERRKLKVWRVGSWADIIPTVGQMLVHRAAGKAGATQRATRSMLGFSAPLSRTGSSSSRARNTSASTSAAAAASNAVPAAAASSQGLANSASGHQSPGEPPHFVSAGTPGGGGGVEGGQFTPGAPAPTPAEGMQGRTHTWLEEPNRVGSAGLLSANGDSGSRGSSLVLAIVDVALVPNLYQFIAEELHIFRARLQNQGFVIAWLVEHNTSADTRRSLRRSGCAVASKPLYASRMAPLLALATARNGVPHSSSNLDMPLPLPSSSSSAGSPSVWGPSGSAPESTPPQGGSGLSNWALPEHPEEDASCTITPVGDQPQDKQMLPSDPSSSPYPAQPPTAAAAAAAAAAAGAAAAVGAAIGAVAAGAVGSQQWPPSLGAAGSGYASSSSDSSHITPPSVATGAAATPAAESTATSRVGVAEPERPGSPPTGMANGASAAAAGRPSRARASSLPKKGQDSNCDNMLAGKRVLIAEDTALLRKVAVIRMQKLGCTVEAVCDGQQAVDAVLATYVAASAAEMSGQTGPADPPRFDAVLMDCQMPVMDGYAATAAIRQAEENTRFHTPVVALTAHAMTSDEKKCLDAGMDAYLTKPIDPPLMCRTLLGLMERYPTTQPLLGQPTS